MKNLSTPVPKLIDIERTEFEGPYECPFCSGHFMVDWSFLDQVDDIIHCMYCCEELKIA